MVVRARSLPLEVALPSKHRDRTAALLLVLGRGAACAFACVRVCACGSDG